MGSRLFSAGKYAEALTLFERNVVAQEAALGPNHPKTTNALHNLATLKTALGDYDEACALFERVLEQRERALGPSHPDFGEPDCATPGPGDGSSRSWPERTAPSPSPTSSPAPARWPRAACTATSTS